jgi:hypothetical protein
MLLMKELERGDARSQFERYDPACERIDTAIKAIWKLYRRGKWVLLSELGLTRREMEALFDEFDAVYITTDHGLIYQEATVQQFIRYEQEKLGTQKILTAAAVLIARYIWTFQDERHEVLERKHAA